MRRNVISTIVIVVVLSICRGDIVAQNLAEEASTVSSTNDRSKLWSAAGIGGFYLALTTWSYFAWYRKDTLDEFTVGGDGLFGQETYAGGADKLGHFWTNATVTRLSVDILRDNGWKPVPAGVIGGGLSWLFFLFVEIKDGYYYQFSIGDLAANTLGVGTGLLLSNMPVIDRWIDFRVDYFPSEEYRRQGSVNFAEDYSGQAYLLAMHLKPMHEKWNKKGTAWMQYVDIVGGFRASNYKPDPIDTSLPRKQEIYFGLALNAQHLVETIFRTSTGRGGQTTKKILHKTFEHASLPYTTLPLLRASRSPD